MGINIYKYIVVVQLRVIQILMIIFNLYFRIYELNVWGVLIIINNKDNVNSICSDSLLFLKVK